MYILFNIIIIIYTINKLKLWAKCGSSQILHTVVTLYFTFIIEPQTLNLFIGGWKRAMNQGDMMIMMS